MTKLDLNNLTVQERSGMMTAIIAPRPVAFVTTLNSDGSINAAPFSFFNAVSYDPPLIMVSVLKENGNLKDTAINILREKEFVVHSVTKDNILLVNETSMRLPYGDSELKLGEFNLIDSELIKTPGVMESKVRFEVKLYNHLDTPNASIFIGEIILMHLSNDIYNNGLIDYDYFKPTGRLVGDNFTELDNVRTIKRPK